MEKVKAAAFFVTLSLFFFISSGFQSDELLVDDEEFGLEGAPPRSSEPPVTRSPTSSRRRHSDSDSDSKIHFPLQHAFADSDFSSAGTFSARLKTSSHGGQTLTKLRFSRDSFSEEEKAKFKKLLEEDDFYRIRLPSNVLSAPGRGYITSSVKARCLPREGLDEHFVIHMEGANIVAVNYGSSGSCAYPRQLKIPTRWSFNSYTILKSTEQAPRAPIFTEVLGEEGEGEVVTPPEKSFWAKYWMYLIPLGLIVMNAVTQAMNMPEEQATGQAGPQRAPSAAVQRRR